MKFRGGFEESIEFKFILAVVPLVVLALFVVRPNATRQPDPPLPQNAVDGLYVNSKCPSFEIRNATIFTGSESIAGEVTKGKRGYLLETEDALRFELKDNSCQIRVIKDRGSLNYFEPKKFGSATQMIKLIDNMGQIMWWTQRPLSQLDPEVQTNETGPQE